MNCEVAKCPSLLLHLRGELTRVPPVGSASASASASACGWRGSWRRRRGGAVSNLDGDNASEGASGVSIGHLDKAYAIDIANGASAGDVRWKSEGNWEVHVDVGSTSRDHSRTLENVPDKGLLGDGSWAVAVVAGHVLNSLELCAFAELSSRSGVQNSGDRSATVGSNDVEVARDVTSSRNLGKSVARERHSLCDRGSLVLAAAGRLT